MNIHTLYAPISRRFRRRRMEAFAARFNLSSHTRILDVGGSEFNWRLLPINPEITFLNLAFSHPPRPGAEWVAASGTALPFADNAFDIVFSNSVIEHVGGDTEVASFAAETRRVGRAYYVQTPNCAFPIEPHYMAPFIHFLPRVWQYRMLRRFSLWGWLTRPTPEAARQFVDSIHLLSMADMRALFPEAQFIRERFFGLTKSLIGWHQPVDDNPQAAGASDA